MRSSAAQLPSYQVFPYSFAPSRNFVPFLPTFFKITSLTISNRSFETSIKRNGWIFFFPSDIEREYSIGFEKFFSRLSKFSWKELIRNSFLILFRNDSRIRFVSIILGEGGFEVEINLILERVSWNIGWFIYSARVLRRGQTREGARFTPSV